MRVTAQTYYKRSNAPAGGDERRRCLSLFASRSHCPFGELVLGLLSCETFWVLTHSAALVFLSARRIGTRTVFVQLAYESSKSRTRARLNFCRRGLLHAVLVIISFRRNHFSS